MSSPSENTRSKKKLFKPHLSAESYPVSSEAVMEEPSNAFGDECEDSEYSVDADCRLDALERAIQDFCLNQEACEKRIFKMFKNLFAKIEESVARKLR